jgi:hypothetical protein
MSASRVLPSRLFVQEIDQHWQSAISTAGTVPWLDGTQGEGERLQARAFALLADGWSASSRRPSCLYSSLRAQLSAPRTKEAAVAQL